MEKPVDHRRPGSHGEPTGGLGCVWALPSSVLLKAVVSPERGDRQSRGFRGRWLSRHLCCSSGGGGRGQDEVQTRRGDGSPFSLDGLSLLLRL